MPSQAPWRARRGGRCGARAALVLEALPPGSRGSRGGRGAPSSRSRRPRSGLPGGSTAGRPFHGTRGGLLSARGAPAPSSSSHPRGAHRPQRGAPAPSRQFHGFGARSGGPLCKRCRRPEAYLDTPFHGRCRVYKGEPRPPHGHGEQFCKRSRVLKGIPSPRKCYNACEVWYGCISGVSLRKQPLARGAQARALEATRFRCGNAAGAPNS